MINPRGVKTTDLFLSHELGSPWKEETQIDNYHLDQLHQLLKYSHMIFSSFTFNLIKTYLKYILVNVIKVLL